MKFDYQLYGSAFVDMRLHKLRVLITEQSDALFASHSIEIPSPCVSVVLFVNQSVRVSIAQIAEATGYSHQLITQRLALLDEMGVTRRSADARDKRKWLIGLTPKGRIQTARLEAFLSDAANAFDDLYRQIGIDLDDVLNKATEALQTNSLSKRVAGTDGETQTPAKRTKLAAG